MSLDSLRASLRLLSAEAGDQTDYLTQLGTAHSADELALEFDDALAPSRHFLSSAAAAAVGAVDDALSAMSGEGHDNLWTLEALRSAPEWQHVRVLARKALTELLIA
jgi:hypothetical protein